MAPSQPKPRYHHSRSSSHFLPGGPTIGLRGALNSLTDKHIFRLASVPAPKFLRSYLAPSPRNTTRLFRGQPSLSGAPLADVLNVCIGA